MQGIDNTNLTTEEGCAKLMEARADAIANLRISVKDVQEQAEQLASIFELNVEFILTTFLVGLASCQKISVHITEDL